MTKMRWGTVQAGVKVTELLVEQLEEGKFYLQDISSEGAGYVGAACKREGMIHFRFYNEVDAEREVEVDEDFKTLTVDAFMEKHEASFVGVQEVRFAQALLPMLTFEPPYNVSFVYEAARVYYELAMCGDIDEDLILEPYQERAELDEVSVWEGDVCVSL